MAVTLLSSTDPLADVLVVRRPELAAGLMDSIRDRMSSRAIGRVRYDLACGDRLHNAGHDDRRVYFIESGAVSMEHFSSTGRRTILDVLPRNDYFGEDSVPGLSSQYTPTALVPTVLIGLQAETFHEIINQAPLQRRWQASLMLKSHRYRSFLLQHATSDCEARLAMRLFDLSDAFGTPAGRKVRIDLRLRHEDYAAMVATTRSRIGFFLNRFTERKMVRREDDGRLVVDPPALVKYVMERMDLAFTP